MMQNESLNPELLPERWLVHSVFCRTANLSAQGFWLTIMNDNEPGPYRLFLPIPDLREAFGPGQVWVMRDDILQHGSHCFRVTRPSAGTPLRSYTFEPNSCEKSVQDIFNKYAPPDDVLWQKLRAWTHCVVDCLHYEQSQGLAQALKAMVGLGRGLSPDGDDILYGLLAGLQAMGRKEAKVLSLALNPDILQKTTDIARQAYCFAQSRLYPARIHCLFEALQNHDPQQISICVKKVAEYGASSGLAILYGIASSIKWAYVSLSSSESAPSGNH